ncbi:multicopper oxidase family protein [Actinoplanes sp. LDG1-06]|uniref:Multicopper oxidase family protein n=1 Tax=Paractinoplanes ovalisporus TaxID=2810368 RepID=A0ABS2A3D5_9ACTN|nr:multicopper oxidase family protein [Actinoplanes ovalisporus]MBM2614353.1 multicopper oxidase family protein [Actinoplanes ovalisporus]
MTTGTLIALDLVAAVLAAAGWLAAGGLSAGGHSARRLSARRRWLLLALAALALLAVVGRVVTTVALARAGWWFAAEKVVIAGPLSVAGAVVAVIFRRALAFLFAGFASAAGLLVTVLHGYPASVGTGLLAVAGVLGATAVASRFFGRSSERFSGRSSEHLSGRFSRQFSRQFSRLTSMAAVVALVAGAGFATRPGPSSRHEHAPLVAANVGEPTKRFTLTASIARDGAWAFNGQVPGPELAVTVGDVLEVTLRNKDISRGVTLHWHGYDVPNDQDGVPGVTQDAVMPGGEFVYRFRADQAGTYWYHTHSASDIGVRKGLYGVLVVRPTSITGVDVTVPVHTLGNVLLPSPTVGTVAPGTPVRLRLINTDSTTHRYAVTGGPFRVAAIDGRDLDDPSPVRDKALLLPAGGRYDVTLVAPAALHVDGRAVWSSSPSLSASPSPSWPVLDPLSYGAPSPVPWSRFDRSFTLVLDRGLDLRGLLPRYAHTVNGAADPDIPVQVVRRGEVVRFTIVNRSLVVHPWHLHGHHVLVLSRDGKAATGSPLWLDSFDVLPGEVWEVAFVADNPGMWANHCHNLPHADAGMMLHLAYAS